MARARVIWMLRAISIAFELPGPIWRRRKETALPPQGALCLRRTNLPTLHQTSGKHGERKKWPREPQSVNQFEKKKLQISHQLLASPPCFRRIYSVCLRAEYIHGLLIMSWLQYLPTWWSRGRGAELTLL